MTAPLVPEDEAMDPALSGVFAAAQQDPEMRDLFGPEAKAVSKDGQQSRTNEIAAPNPPDDMDETEPLERLRDLMVSLYGSDFPLVNALDEMMAEDPSLTVMPPLEAMLARTSADEWAQWTRGRWSHHRAAVEMHLYLVARNRLFRSGQQWVSSRGTSAWREPPRQTDTARVVHNLIDKALDQRIQILTDQKPGFQVEPTSLSPDEKRKAKGRQQALEFHYDQQQMERQMHEAAYWAGTDGCAFWHTYWDRDAGPWDERMGDQANPGSKKPLGDLRTDTLRVEQVRVSANATATKAPHYVVIRDVLSETEAAYLYRESGVQQTARGTGDLALAGDSNTSGANADGVMPSWVLTQTIVGEGNRLNNVQTVERFTMYVEKQPDILPEGLQLVVLGNAVVWGPGELLFGMIPVVRFTDGSTDPSYYPRPIMEQWIAPQMRINAALSLWVNSVRVNSGGRFLAKPDAISRETFIGSGLSIIEVEGGQSIGDTVVPVNGFLVGQDVKDLIAFDVKAFEDASGYNETSRGQVSKETATAVATANEHLVRVFAPAVHAAARGLTDWSKVQLAGMAWGYDLPRDMGTIGSDRPDLARALSGEDFDGPASVRVDPEQMMPMPKMYRLAILDDRHSRGLISNQQYMRSAPYGDLTVLDSPDEDQHARAKRVTDALRLRVPHDQVPPIRWQDNESIHQDALERDILLQDDLPPDVIVAADERWRALAQQAAEKAGALGPTAPVAGDPTAPPDDGGGGEPMIEGPAGPELVPDSGGAPSPVSPISPPAGMPGVVDGDFPPMAA